MKKIGISLLLLCGAVAASQLGARAAHPRHPGACEPGYQWMEVTEYKEVCRDVCRVVPDVKKTTKWVYSTIDDPFCIHSDGHHGHGHHGQACDASCPTCKGPHCRKQLVKTAVVCEEPTTRCVVEKIVEKVPCKVWRKVACAPTTEVPAAPAPPPPAPAVK